MAGFCLPFIRSSDGQTMAWNGVHPAVHLVDKVYHKGVKLTKEAMKICEERIERLEYLPKWDITINPIIW